MFGVGGSELLVIALIALLVFGPDKLPELMKKVARVIREVRQASDEVRMHIDPDGDLYRATHFPPNFNTPPRRPDIKVMDQSDSENEPIDAAAEEIEQGNRELPPDDPERKDS